MVPSHGWMTRKRGCDRGCVPGGRKLDCGDVSVAIVAKSHPPKTAACAGAVTTAGSFVRRPPTTAERPVLAGLGRLRSPSTSAMKSSRSPSATGNATAARASVEGPSATSHISAVGAQGTCSAFRRHNRWIRTEFDPGSARMTCVRNIPSGGVATTTPSGEGVASEMSFTSETAWRGSGSGTSLRARRITSACSASRSSMTESIGTPVRRFPTDAGLASRSPSHATATKRTSPIAVACVLIGCRGSGNRERLVDATGTPSRPRHRCSGRFGLASDDLRWAAQDSNPVRRVKSPVLYPLS